MSENDIKHEVNTDGETKNVTIHPGDCFGWYSHVSADCHPSSCLRSEMCKSYSLGRANQAETSIKKDIKEIGKDSSERIKEAQINPKETKKNMVDLGKQAFFDKIVSITANLVQHDSIKYSPKRNSASLKIGGRVEAFVAKKRSNVVLELGSRGKGGPTYTAPFGENMEIIKPEVESFIKENG